MILCITNYVAAEFTANVLLAIGERPLMSSCPEEMDELTARCDALLVNIGCLDRQQIEAMKIAVEAAKRYGKPWVLDPVGVQASQIRLDTCKELIALNAPTMIKGNKAEMEFILPRIEYAGVAVTTGAVDWIESRKSGMSRKSGYSGDSGKSASIALGSPMMDGVTGMGCALGGVCAAFLAREADPFKAAVKALTLYGKAGQDGSNGCNGKSGQLGTFKTKFIDELSRLS